MIKKLLCFFLSFTILTVSTAFAVQPVASTEESNEIKYIKSSKGDISGTFVYPSEYMSATYSDWQEALDMGKSMGVSVLFNPTTAYLNKDGNWDVYYDTDLSEIKDHINSQNDVVEDLLYNAEVKGLRVYLGIGEFEDIDNLDLSNADGQETFKTYCSTAADIASELFEKYKKKYPNTFEGFYFTPKLRNISTFNSPQLSETYLKTVSDGYNIILDKIHSLSDKMPFVFSPSYNPKGFGTVENTNEFISNLLLLCHFKNGDIMAPSDYFGTNSMDILDKKDTDLVSALWDQYSNILNKYKQSTGIELHLWGICEDFLMIKDSPYPATIDRLATQMKTLWNKSEMVIFTSLFSMYNSKDFTRDFKNSLSYYIQDHRHEPDSPSSINKISTETTDYGLKLTWTPCTDSSGVAYYIVYKYNDIESDMKTLDYITPVRNGDKYVIANSYTDTTYVPGIYNVYQIEAVDCNGNRTPRFSVHVTKGQENNNVNIVNEESPSGVISGEEVKNLLGNIYSTSTAVYEVPLNRHFTPINWMLIGLTAFFVIFCMGIVAVFVTANRITRKNEAGSGAKTSKIAKSQSNQKGTLQDQQKDKMPKQ